MSHKTATVALEGDGLRFVARTGSGHSLALDNKEGDTGPRPAELVPVAVAACTAMDVISILRKKRQDVTRYEVQASGEQEEQHPNAFTRIDVTHVVEGPALDVAAVQRSIELSATRYCSVGATLSTGALTIHHGYVVRSGGSEHTGEVVVTGPGEDPSSLGQHLATAAAGAAD
jgi:putative redox protein